jgi:hypothetical protein
MKIINAAGSFDFRLTKVAVLEPTLVDDLVAEFLIHAKQNTEYLERNI